MAARAPAEIRAELQALLASWEYAFAMGATRTLGGRDPRLQGVLDRVAELRRELAAADGDAGPPG